MDKIVKENSGLHYNRQQFIETAIREKIEKNQLIKARTPTQVQKQLFAVHNFPRFFGAEKEHQ